MTTPTPLPPQAQQLLEKMHDIAEPGPVSWWPLAPGWWVLIILSLAIIGSVSYWLIQRTRRNRYRKEALRLLNALSVKPQEHSIAELNEIIKRTALQAYPKERAEIARSFGTQWVAWLNSKCKKPVIDEQTQQELAQGGYRSDGGKLSPTLIAVARHWIIQHAPTKAQPRSSHA